MFALIMFNRQTSICSTNSAINSLWKQSILNSPAKSQEKPREHKRDDVSKQETFDSTNPSLGETLLNDIQCFLDKTKDNVQTAEVSRYFNYKYIFSHFTNLKDCKSESLSETSTIINDDVEDPDEDEEDTADNEDVVHYFHREETPQNPNTNNNVHIEDNPEHQISILKLRVLGMYCCTL